MAEPDETQYVLQNGPGRAPLMRMRRDHAAHDDVQTRSARHGCRHGPRLPPSGLPFDADTLRGSFGFIIVPVKSLRKATATFPRESRANLLCTN